jgi:hypothetical protein
MYYPEYSFDNRQLNYINDIESTIRLHDAPGRVFDLRLMFYQKVFHADCIVANPLRYPHRIVYSCRGSGKSDSISIDSLFVAKTFQHMKIPVSSTRLENSENIIDWINFLVDNAKINFKRDRRVDAISRFPGNDTEVIQIPGGNPDSIRSNRTSFMVFDEFAFLLYRDQKKLWDGGRRCMSEGGQLSILSTVNTRNDKYYQAFKEAKELGFRIYVWTLFPPEFFDHNKSIFESIDDEYLEAYYEDDEPAMRRLCDKAYQTGLWDAGINFDVESDQKDLPYWGLWPEDRGLIPLSPWLDLDDLETDRKSDLASFLKENQGKVEEMAGTFFPEKLLMERCTVPVNHLMDTVIAHQLEGNQYTLYTGGFDSGGKSNYAAIAIFEESQSGKFREVYTETFWQLDTPGQLEKALLIEKFFPGLYAWGVDTTGQGYQFAQFLDRESSRRVYGIDAARSVVGLKTRKTETRSSMARAAAYKFRMGLIDGEIDLLDSKTIRDDALLIQAADLKSKTIKEAEGVSHADRTWAAIFARYVADLDVSIALTAVVGSSAQKAKKEDFLRKTHPLDAFPLGGVPPAVPHRHLGRKTRTRK